MDTDAYTIDIGYPSDNKLLGTSFQKPARGPAGAKLARASAFIIVSILTNADALAGILMPAGASAFDSASSLTLFLDY